MDIQIMLLSQDNAISFEMDRILSSHGFVPLHARTWESAEQALTEHHPDLIMVQGSAPGLDAVRICRSIKESKRFSHIPVLIIENFVSGRIDEYLQCGYDEYLLWPASPFQIITRVNSVVSTHLNRREIVRISEMRTEELLEVQSVLIESLATLAEYRDEDTGKHIKRTQNYVKALTHELKKDSRYEADLSDQMIEWIHQAVSLHDIGKVGVRDDVLLKPGKLTKEEFETMKQHTVLGHDVLRNAVRKLKNNTFLKLADDVAFTHQEKWDGTGYPQGLKGNEIPLIGRLMAVADVYDALITKRPYKDAMTHEEALQIIIDGYGSHFDPDIVDAFLAVSDTIKNISQVYEVQDRYDRHDMKHPLDEKMLDIENVLVVDDSRLTRTIIENQLTNIGYNVTTAPDGQSAFDLYTGSTFDLVITDLEMPVANGYDLVRNIRSYEHEHDKNALIIAMTSNQFRLTPEEAKSYGFDDYLLKPLDIDLLKTKLMVMEQQPAYQSAF